MFKSKTNKDSSSQDAANIVKTLHSRMSAYDPNYVAQIIALRVHLLFDLSKELDARAFANPQWVASEQGRGIYSSMDNVLAQHIKSCNEVGNKADNFGLPLPKSIIVLNNLWQEAFEFLMSEISLSFQPEMREKVLDIWNFSRSSFQELPNAISEIRKTILALEETGAVYDTTAYSSMADEAWIVKASELPEYVKALHGN